MITNTGKNILAKYLIGNAPAYASHIALGCGAIPLETSAELDDYSDKQVLDFEMFRVPISSRGYITEDNETKIVFTAEIPSLERYEITEIGLYSAGSNPLISGYDSRILYSFARQEAWTYNGNTLPIIDTPLDATNATNDLATTSLAFQTNATNRFFANINRQKRNEQCRYLNNMVMIRGDFSPTGTTSTNFISLPTGSLNLERNASSDIMKVAFSLVNVSGTTPAAKPDEVNVTLQFLTTTGETATFLGQVKDSSVGGDYDFNDTRYFIVSKSLGQITKSTGFLWSQVSTLKIFVSVVDGAVATDDYFVALDAVRIDNISSENPIYGLTGYSVIVNQGTDGTNTYPTPVIKFPNSSSYVEFRLGIDI
jgi:hypothetical protein